MQRHKIQDGGARVVWNPKWQRLVASFFVNIEIVLLRQILSSDYFSSIYGNFFQQWRIPLTRQY